MNDSGASTLFRVRLRMLPGTLRFVLHDGVQAALHAGRAVVALESTIITHGLPRPLNYDMAVAVAPWLLHNEPVYVYLLLVALEAFIAVLKARWIFPLI